MCGGGRAGLIALLIFRMSGRFQQRTTAKDPPPLAPLFAVSLLTLSYTVLNYLAKTSNNWSQSVIVVNTADINSLSIGCVCACACVRVEAGSGCEGAKMCGVVANWQGQTIPRGKIQNLFHAICVSLALVCRLVWMVSSGVAGAVL